MAKKLCMGCMEEYEDSFNVCPVCGYAEGTGPREAYHIMPGTVLQGKYIVGRSIGYGGFGITYIGYDYALGHKIAIKEYLPGEFSTRCMGDKKVTIFEGEKQEQFLSGIEKFVDEARRLAGFRDVDGVVTVYDSFKENNTAYIVMEYLEGRTLKEILQEKGKLDLEEAVAYIVPILDALSEIHKEGLLHRDISPDNIFVTNDGRVKLIDFGAARYATTTHSKSLSVIVKPGYAPQEQYRSRGDQGPWTDVYACAATLYKMITGITPEDSMERGDKDTLKEPRKAGARIPKNKQNAIMNALNLKVEDRTQTAEAFKEELLSDNWVQRRKNTLKKMDIGRWPLWVKISSGVGAAAVATVLVLLLTGVIRFSFENGRLHFQIGEGNTLVPSVLNYAEAEAKEIVEQHNLVFSVGGEKESDEIAEGIVLDQGSRAGSEVPEDSVLFVYISKGRGKADIDNYIGRKEEEVKKELEEKSIPYITERGESEIAPGCIYEQSIEKGTSVEKGTDIKLMVSAGIAAYDKKKDTKVPKLVGKAFDEGRKAVRDSHLYIRVTSWKESNDIPEGQIIKQDKKAGTSVKEGEIVGVTVSLGIRKERVKDVTGEYIDDAIQILEKQGFRVRKETEKSDSVAKGYVIRQDPGADTETEVTKAGKPVEIVLWVSEGSEEMNGAVPNITGRVFDDVVKSILSEYGYRLGQITYKNGTSKSQDGRILEQSPAAGRIAAEGTAVDITVYRYVEAAAEDVTDDRVEVPNVTGKSLDAAKAILEEKELKGQVISWVNTDQEKLKDQVKAQDRTSGLVDRGTTIKLTVYKYVPKKGSDKKAEADVEKKKEEKKEEKKTEKKTEEQKKEIKEKKKHTLYFNANEGYVGETSRKLEEGEKYGKLPTPSRTYYTFVEWNYDQYGLGDAVSDSDIMEENDVTVYAIWSVKNESDWVLESSVPRGAKITQTKWIYDRTETKESKTKIQTGWSLQETKTSYGSWSAWSTAAATKNESLDVEKRTIQEHSGYNLVEYNYAAPEARYYHKTYPSTTQYVWGPRNLTVSIEELNSYPAIGPGGWSGGKFAGINASGETGYQVAGQDGIIYFIASNTYNNVVQYRKRSISYTYIYKRTVREESSSLVQESERISNVQKWVKYIEE